MVFAAGSIFDPVYNFFGAILAFFYGIIPNLGVSIILLTVVVMLALFPLTAKQAKAMMHMQRAQPEIKKLQAKYKNDRAKLNEEVMKFYQENKINPLAGCLPLLVQMPIFLALFRVMREPYKHIPKGSDLYAAFCTTSNGVLHVKECNVPKLGLPNPQYFLGMDLSQNATGVSGGFLDALPYFILVGLVIITAFAQSRQSRRNAPNMTSQMAMISTVLPIAFGLFSLQFPAGLVLYFLDQQPVATRPAGADHAQDHRAHQGPRADRREGRRQTSRGDRRRRSAAANAEGSGRSAEAVPARGPAADRGRSANGDVAEPSGNGTAKQTPAPKAQAQAGAKPARRQERRRQVHDRRDEPKSEQRRKQAARRKTNKRRKRR